MYAIMTVWPWLLGCGTQRRKCSCRPKINSQLM
ncbi:Uncharacterised protein [Vibrio cholerae]|nr:Uncharacterised protein [Vibrio cholerae]